MNTTEWLVVGGVVIGTILLFIFLRNKAMAKARKKSLAELNAVKTPGAASAESSQPASEEPVSDNPAPSNSGSASTPPENKGSGEVSPDKSVAGTTVNPDLTALLEAIKKYDSHFSTLAKGLRDHHKSVDSLLLTAQDIHSQHDGLLSGIRDYLAMKNDLTDRLQEGYDYRILKNFVKQIIRSIHQIETDLSDEAAMDPVQKLQAVRGDLLDMLDRHGIERIIPEVGTPFANVRKVAEVAPHKEPTEDKNLSGKIAEVVRPGYRYMINPDQHRVIMPAQVVIYEFARSK